MVMQHDVSITDELKRLQERLAGELSFDALTLVLYSTDASAYRERPLAVFFPCEDCENDIKILLDFCRKHQTFLIPRAAGTSLAGQVVGKGIVVDVSRRMNKILELNSKERWVRVQPGVVLEELNNYLKPFGLFFAPETSTANRCCVGGMAGNNSCGLHSLVYGSVREHILEARVLLSNGEQTVLKQLSKEEFEAKTHIEGLEGEIYRFVSDIRSDMGLKERIEQAFPEKCVPRRNNGYALDSLYEGDAPNLAKLFCGSEGTLAFATELKLNLLPLSPKEKAVLCVHFADLYDSFEGNLTALRHNPMAVELMDDHIVEAAYRNPAQKQNTFFIQGSPKAVLIVEFADNCREVLLKKVQECKADFEREKKAYAYSIVEGHKVARVWALRKAGLGLLTNIPGNDKPVSVIEDTAVGVEKLPNYMRDFEKILEKHNLKCVYHAHIATGELHLRPVLNLKKEEDVQLFRQISREIALLVKRYRGSLSGEHGDGRLRGEWIPLMYGEEIYRLMCQTKKVWDKDNVFNSGKIVNTPSMNESLRYQGANAPEIKTYYSFEKEKGLQCAAERCNGAADCRKSQTIGGLMCPTFKATGSELDTPRARANIIREMLSFSCADDPLSENIVKNALDNCLMCKACKRECPSNVDITKLKSEVLQHHYDKHGYPLSVLMINSLPKFQQVGSMFPSIYNWFVSNALTSSALKALMGFAPQREIPKIYPCNFSKQFDQATKANGRTIYLFIDEFSRFQDTSIAKTAIKLFSALGFEVKQAPIEESGRMAISKGMVKRAKRLAERNVGILKELISEQTPLVGIEPSTTLSFRDEYPDLLGEDISSLTQNVFLFDEFIAKQADLGVITPELFTDKKQHILLHGHCQQKALTGTEFMERMLCIPTNYSVEVIPSGCCGMAGSYGYEKRHYEMSKTIANSVLIPAIEKAAADTIIAAPGTSCREQIKHFSSRTALHPIEILYNALKEK